MAMAAAVAALLLCVPEARAVETPPHPDASVFLPLDRPMRNRHQEVRIRLRDGVELAADLYLPKAEGRYPVIVEATVYGKRDPKGFAGERDYWTDKGYAFLIVDVRGQHGSGGSFDFFRDAIDDGYDMVEWAGTQVWSDGNVGMRGSSFSGTYPWYAAKNSPPHLKCINPNASLSHPFQEVPYAGGAFKQSWGLTWISSLGDSGVAEGSKVDWHKQLDHRPLLTADEAAFGKPLALYRTMLSHPTLDDYWKPITYGLADYAGIAIPSLAFSGWFDGTLPGTIRNFQGMQAHSPRAAEQYLVIGPWEHYYVADGGWDYETGKRRDTVGDMRLPDTAFLPGQKMTTAFFDWCLKGAAKPAMPAAKMFITGANAWLDLPAYPLPDARPTALYIAGKGAANGLSGAGLLSPDKPVRGRVDRYTYDPQKPVPSYILRDGKRTDLTSVPIDMTSLLDRPDMLVYATPPLDAPMTVLGNVRMTLYAASSARDTDFAVQIEDVAPDGSAVKLGPQVGGIVRARYRNGFEKTELLTPGKVEQYDISLFDIGHQFRTGHRIRVSITSSSWPFHHRNPNTGNPIATDEAAPVKAKQTIYRTARYPSHITLPVIADPGGGQ